MNNGKQKLNLANKSFESATPEAVKIREMSTFSLPRLCNSSGLSNNRTVNSKFATLDSRGARSSGVHLDQKRQTLTRCENEMMERRKAIDRRGSINQYQFRGIKREHLERKTKQIIHSMTVCLAYNRLCSIW